MPIMTEIKQSLGFTSNLIKLFTITFFTINNLFSENIPELFAKVHEQKLQY